MEVWNFLGGSCHQDHYEKLPINRLPLNLQRYPEGSFLHATKEQSSSYHLALKFPIEMGIRIVLGYCCLNGSHPIGKKIGINAHSIPIATKIQDRDSVNHCLNRSHSLGKEIRFNSHSTPIMTMIKTTYFITSMDHFPWEKKQGLIPIQHSQ